MADPRTVQRALNPPASIRRRAVRTVITPAPTPAVPPRPQGNLDEATPGQIIELIDTIWPHSRPRRCSRRNGVQWLLGHLAEQPGTTWQERWINSGLNDGVRRVRQLATGKATLDGELGHSLMLLCCLRVIRPSLAAFRINSFVRYHKHFEAAQNDPDLDRFLELVERQDTSGHFKRCARFDIAGVLTSQGIVLADLTAESLLHYATETRAGGWGGGYEAYVGHLAWQVLHESGHFAPSVPATLRGAMRAPAMTPAELVEIHDINNIAVRDMLIAYLTRRSHDLDYPTLQNLSADLCKKFWKQIELINPAQADLCSLAGDLPSVAGHAVCPRRWETAAEHRCRRDECSCSLPGPARLGSPRTRAVGPMGRSHPDREPRNPVEGQSQTPRQGTHGRPNPDPATIAAGVRGGGDRTTRSPPRPPESSHRRCR